MRSRSRLGSAVVFAVAGSLAAAGGAAVAEEAVFAEDFELGDVCGWTAAVPPLAAIAESEPNDETATADPVARCGTVEGAIAAPSGEPLGADFDFFRITVAEPTLLRITLAERDGSSDFDPYFDLDDAEQSYPPLGIGPLATGGATTRQLWVPEAGTWYLFVSDHRNWDRIGVPEEPPGAGGPAGTYRLSLSVAPIEPQTLFFALSGEPLSIPADGALVLYRLPVGLTDFLDAAEVFAERLASPSPLDAKLFLLREEITGRIPVAQCDDQTDGGACDTGIENVDPRLEGLPVGEVPHLLIVDFFDAYDPDTLEAVALPAGFELDVQFLPLEP